MEDMPVLEDAQALVEQGVFTGASTRNWAGYGHDVRHPAQFTDWQRNLLSDPQTAGGLLVACAPAAVEEVLQVFRGQGFARASVIGVMHDGDATLTIAP
jgi:selenide,water dikinase